MNWSKYSTSSGKIYAGINGQVWHARPGFAGGWWKPIPAGSVATALDCPSYATPEEATMRAHGLPPTRYIGESR